MKKTFTFLAFVMLLSLSCFAQNSWRPVVKVHLPKGDTSKVFVFATSTINLTRIDTVRAEKVKGNTYYFHFPNGLYRSFWATSDKYEPDVVFAGAGDGGYIIDLYLKTPRKEPVKSQKEETAKLLKLMLEKIPNPELYIESDSNTENVETIEM